MIVDDTASYIRETNLFDCGVYQSVTLKETFGSHEILRKNDLVFTGGFYGLVVYDVNDGTVLFSDDTYRVRDMEFYENTVLICTNNGIYEYLSPTEVPQRVAVNCTSLLLTAEQELIFTNNSNPSQYDVSRLYRYDSPGETTVYSNQNTESTCITMSKLTQASNGDLWMIDCSSNYVRFRSGEFLDVFDNTNSPLFDNNRPEDASFVEPYGDAMVVVTKNGNSNYLVAKYENEEWTTLYDLGALRETNVELSAQDVEFSLPSVNGAQIKGDFLYVATTIAGCRGVHVFDVSKNGPLTADDYYVVQDPALPQQCIDALEIDADGNIYIIVNDELVVIDC